MTFLQSSLLWGLPLVALPVLIHLLNRMRYRTMPWAAMMFLLTASRHSVRHARLRHFLLLLCRVLVLVVLIVALARPLVGGWAGWALQRAPDTIIIALDRSASMEAQDAQTHTSKRVRALQRLVEAAGHFAGGTRFVLLENVARVPHELSSPALLPELSVTAATDAAADIPALLEAAVEYVTANQCGRTEIWLASDLQKSNWQPQASRWASLQQRIVALPQEVRVRLLNFSGEPVDNVWVSVPELRRQKVGGRAELVLTVDLGRNGTERVSFPLSVGLDGSRSLVNVTMEVQHLRFQHKIDLGTRLGSVWGVVELPPDANLRDNQFFFAFNAEQHLNAVVVAEDAVAGPLLRLATVPAPRAMNQSCELVTPAEAAGARWAETALVVWQGALPDTAAVRGFVESGGTVICFPPGRAEARKFGDVSWSEPATAEAEKPFRIRSWRNEEGPLAKTTDGLDLPVTELKCLRRQPVLGETTVLAAFEDGKPFLSRRTVGRGNIYFCAVLPQAEWSNLGEGTVLVPVLQRLLAAGGQRLGQAANAACGEAPPGAWQRVDAAKAGGEPQTVAGVYQQGQRVLAVNRPAAEDAPEILDEAAVRSLFGPVPLTLFEQAAANSKKMESEIWRGLIGLLLVLLLAESWLAMPERTKPREGN